MEQNLLLLVIDSLRADHLSGLGYPRPTSPFLDSLMEESVVFDHFFTPVTPTQPAITTLFTGQFPWAHGIVAQSGRNTLSSDAPWLPEILARNGCVTAALDNLAQAKKWFARGFKDYMNLRTKRDQYYRCSLLNRHALQWLKRHRGSRFFLYLRYGEPHTPYQPPPPYRFMFYEGDPTTTNAGSLDPFYSRPLKPRLVSEWLESAARDWPGAKGKRIEDIRWVRAQYDGEIRAADDGVREMVQGLEELGLLESTIVVVLGDHGESLGEHGIYFEHHGLYECCLRPPLIVHWPRELNGERRSRAVVQLPDVAPTLLDMLGLPVPEAMDGRSLVPLLWGEEPGTGSTEILACESTWMCKWALRTRRFKVIVAREEDLYGKPSVEVYDLLNDPGETANLAEDDEALRARMVGELESRVTRGLKEAGRTADPVAVHGSVRDKLLPKPSFGNRLGRFFFGRGKRSAQ